MTERPTSSEPLRTWARVLFLLGGVMILIALGLAIYTEFGLDISGATFAALVAFGTYRGFQGRRIARWSMALGATVLAWTFVFFFNYITVAMLVGWFATLVGATLMGRDPTRNPAPRPP